MKTNILHNNTGSKMPHSRRAAIALLVCVLSAGLVSRSRAVLVGEYLSTAGVTEAGGAITMWADQQGGYTMNGINSPTLVAGATPNGMPAVMIEGNPEQDDAFQGSTAAPTGFPLAGATAFTAAVLFNPDEVFDNDAGNVNFWGHPALVSGDMGGGAPDWGFSWGPNGGGVNNVWFGVGEDTGGGTPTTTVAGADNNGDWYIGIATWDGGAGSIGLYLYGENGGLIGSNTLATPNATVGRVDVGASIGGENPNPAFRSFDGMIAAVQLFDNAVNASGADDIALDLFADFIGGTPVVPLRIEVNTSTGAVTLQNTNAMQDYTIDYYEITSAGSALDADGWDSLDEQMIDVDESLTGDYNGDGLVNAPDYVVYRNTFGDTVTPGEGADGSGNGMIDLADYDQWANNYGESGGGAGIGWTESGGSDANLLGELYLGAAGSTIEAGESISLGNAFNTGAGSSDLVFQYALVNGGVVDGDVVYVNSGSGTAVPEPATAVVALLALLVAACSRRRE